jgi:hypothetical protein
MQSEVVMKEEQQQIQVLHSPPMERHISIYPAQLIGIGVLGLIIGLALLGVFGESAATVDGRSADFAVQVQYPGRFRYQAHTPLVVTLRNLSDQTLAVTVDFSTDYISQFPDITFNPPISQITAEAYEAALADVLPGETRIVTAALDGGQYGQHNGTIRISAPGAAPVQLEIETFVFP